MFFTPDPQRSVPPPTPPRPLSLPSNATHAHISTRGPKHHPTHAVISSSFNMQSTTPFNRCRSLLLGDSCPCWDGKFRGKQRSPSQQNCNNSARYLLHCRPTIRHVQRAGNLPVLPKCDILTVTHGCLVLQGETLGIFMLTVFFIALTMMGFRWCSLCTAALSTHLHI